jgi:hypothetical protein
MELAIVPRDVGHDPLGGSPTTLPGLLIICEDHEQDPERWWPGIWGNHGMILVDARDRLRGSPAAWRRIVADTCGDREDDWAEFLNQFPTGELIQKSPMAKWNAPKSS